ncbi:MAG: hypothetical protein F6J97_14950 [Leptolyngbya sp. SIO4C1]|nr:hypothetical protein [Leptolyngbya sp. SIO4C1]
MHLILVKLFAALQPYLVPICFVLAWSVVILSLWNIFAAARDGVQKAKTMHQIPCANCKFFTNSHHLKCPVHPAEALTETAIGCHDFEIADPVAAASLRQKVAREQLSL